MKINEFLYHKKIKNLKKLLDENSTSSSVELLKEFASLSFKAGDYSQAKEIYEDLWKNRKLSFWEAEVYLSILLEEGNTSKAKEILESFSSEKDKNCDYLCDLALIEAVEGNRDKVFSVLEEVKEKFSFSEESNLLIYLTEGVCFYYLGDIKRGRQYLVGVLEKYNELPRYYNFLLYSIIRFMVKEKRYSEARFFLTYLVSVDDLEDYFRYAILFINLKLFSKALVYLDYYLKNKEDPAAFFLQGICLSNLPRREKEALHSFLKAYSLDSENYIYLYFLALQFISLGNFEKAAQYLEDAFKEELLQESPEYVYVLAMSKFFLGEEETTIMIFKRGLENFPEHPELLLGFLRIMEFKKVENPALLEFYRRAAIVLSPQEISKLDFSWALLYIEEANKKSDKKESSLDIISEAKNLLLHADYLSSYQLFYLVWIRNDKDLENKITAGYYLAKIACHLGVYARGYYYINEIWENKRDNFYVLYLYIKLSHLNGFKVSPGVLQDFKFLGEKEGRKAVNNMNWESVFQIYERLFDIFQDPRYFFYYVEALDALGKTEELEKEISSVLPRLDFSEFPEMKMVLEENYGYLAQP